MELFKDQGTLAKTYLRNEGNTTTLIKLHLILTKIHMKVKKGGNSDIHIISVRVCLRSFIVSLSEWPLLILVCFNRIHFYFNHVQNSSSELMKFNTVTDKSKRNLFWKKSQCLFAFSIGMLALKNVKYLW